MADGQVLAELLLAHLTLDSYLHPCTVSKMANERCTVADYRPSTVILKEVLPLKVNTFKL